MAFSSNIPINLYMILFILVSHDLDNKGAWTPCVNVKGVTLPTGYYFGASAITGMSYEASKFGWRVD